MKINWFIKTTMCLSLVGFIHCSEAKNGNDKETKQNTESKTEDSATTIAKDSMTKPVSDEDQNGKVMKLALQEDSIVCNGTEPFWNITITKKGITYMSPEVTKQTFPYTAPKVSANKEVKIFTLYGKGGSRLIVVLKNTAQNCPCSDGMSEKTFTHEVTVMRDETVMQGCGQIFKVNSKNPTKIKMK